MDLRLLEYFLVVEKELHFTRAAEKLGISQPTLSQQIKVLENSVGTPLFNRIGKKIHLTEVGEVLKTHALRSFYELEQARTAINEIKGLQRGKLTIACCGSYILTSAITSFHQQYPNVHLSIIELPTEETKQALLANEIDLGIVYLPVEEKRIISQLLYNEEFYLVVSKNNEFANTPYVELRQLNQMKLVLLREEYLIRQIIDNKIKGSGLNLKPTIELTTLESLLHLTAQNIGATILPGNYLNSIDNEKIRKIKILDVFDQIPVGIITREDVYHCESLKMFIKYIKENYKVGEK